MPEGPEIKRMADSLSKAIKNKKIVSAQFLFPTIRILNSLQNISVLDVFSKGKSIIIRLDIGKSIITHNQLYGKWTVNYLKTKIRHNRKLRIEFNTGYKAARLWSATDITLLESEKENRHHYLKKLGPDILSTSISKYDVFDRLRSKSFVNKNLGGLLLNQNFIAGLGNYLRSEILFFCGLLPSVRPKELDDLQMVKLSEYIKIISVRAYKQKGITIDQEEFSDRFGNIYNFRLIRHMVFDRENQPCFYCGNTIIKFFQSSRRYYFCGTCQS